MIFSFSHCPAGGRAGSGTAQKKYDFSLFLSPIVVYADVFLPLSAHLGAVVKHGRHELHIRGAEPKGAVDGAPARRAVLVLLGEDDAGRELGAALAGAAAGEGGGHMQEAEAEEEGGGRGGGGRGRRRAAARGRRHIAFVPPSCFAVCW